jgi:hypothetical protein
MTGDARRTHPKYNMMLLTARTFAEYIYSLSIIIIRNGHSTSGRIVSLFFFTTHVWHGVSVIVVASE